MKTNAIILILLLLVLAGIGVGTNIWYKGRIEDAFNRGMAKASENHLRAENTGLRMLQERVATLITDSDRIENENRSLKDAIKQFDSRDNANSGLRDKQARAYTNNLTEATPESLRRSAEACDSNFTRSREHVKRFGLEAAECSRTAETQQKTLDSWQKTLTGGLPPLPELPPLPKD